MAPATATPEVTQGTALPPTLSFKPNFVNYMFKEDMISDVNRCLRSCHMKNVCALYFPVCADPNPWVILKLQVDERAGFPKVPLLCERPDKLCWLFLEQLCCSFPALYAW